MVVESTTLVSQRKQRPREVVWVWAQAVSKLLMLGRVPLLV
jgi:hypothetical protein